MILTELCRVDKALFLYPESRVPDTVICKRMAVSGTPLSPSFGTQEGNGERSNTCGGNPHHTPHGTGTLLTVGHDGIGAMLILTRRPAGLRLSLIRISDGLPTLSWPMARKVPVPCALSYLRRYGMYGIYTPRWRENAVDAVTIHYLFLVHMLPSGICFLPCKGTSRQLDGIGFHSEHIGNLPFRAGFESVFPTFSAQTFRMPCG